MTKPETMPASITLRSDALPELTGEIHEIVRPGESCSNWTCAPRIIAAIIAAGVPEQETSSARAWTGRCATCGSKACCGTPDFTAPLSDSAGTEGRKIDPKFSIRDGQIVKVSSGEIVPEWEPLILMRARDHLLLPVLRHYRKLSELDGCNDYHLSLLDERIDEFERFAREHPEWMKQPGVTRGAAFIPDAPKPAADRRCANCGELASWQAIGGKYYCRPSCDDAKAIREGRAGWGPNGEFLKFDPPAASNDCTKCGCERHYGRCWNDGCDEPPKFAAASNEPATDLVTNPPYKRPGEIAAYRHGLRDGQRRFDEIVSVATDSTPLRTELRTGDELPCVATDTTEHDHEAANELKACPFCGVMLVLLGDYTNETAWNFWAHPFLDDANCVLSEHTIGTLSDMRTPNPKDALAWNRRAAPPLDAQALAEEIVTWFVRIDDPKREQRVREVTTMIERAAGRK